MPPNDHWMPRLKAPPKPIDAPIVREQQQISVSPQAPVELSVTLQKDAPVAPRGWRFVPERDANNLIVEVIATPI